MRTSESTRSRRRGDFLEVSQARAVAAVNLRLMVRFASTVGIPEAKLTAKREAVMRTSDYFRSFPERPNKAPEPTRGSVTPRAVEVLFRMKNPTANRHTARGAPAPRVAHL